MTPTQAAAERLRRAKAFRDGCPWECTAVYKEGPNKPSARFQYVLDMEEVSNAYLELVPADDGEPITKESFQRLTGVTGHHFDFDEDFGLYFNGEAVELFAEEAGEKNYTLTRKFETVGQIRRLLAALGVGT